MENYDDDFSTIKQRPAQLVPKTMKPLNTWKADIPMADGDATIKLKQKPMAANVNSMDNGFDDDFEDDFDNEDFESDLKTAVRNHKTQKLPVLAHHKRAPSELSLSDAFLSDSSNRSPGRASVSSLASSVSVATSWDQDDDFGFEFDDRNNGNDLEARFRARVERAEKEAQREAAELAANYQKTVSKRSSRPFIDLDDDILDMDMEQLTLRVKNGTVNRNVKLNQTPQQPKQQSRLLKGMRSIAQLPQQRSDIVPPPQRVRGAVSMLDLGSRAKFSSFQQSPQHQNLQPHQQRLRPLTAYKEPVKKPSRPDTKKPKKITTIRNPIQNLHRQERDGMVFNPNTLTWEGNDVDASRFDTLESIKPNHTAKPTLITKQKFFEEHKEDNELAPKIPKGMLFDNRTLSWVYANEEEYDDPFTGIEDSDRAPPTLITPSKQQTYTPHFQSPTPTRRVTNDSQASTATSIGRHSVARSESSGREVFEVSRRLVTEWKHADERFMRKFGKWIGGEEEAADALNSDQHFYEMVKHA